MIKVFNTDFIVTQVFGNNIPYYKQISNGQITGGHEGLDVVCKGNDKTIFSLPYQGKVIEDIDMGVKGGVYGIHTTIWYPNIKEAWEYCHLDSNNVSVNQQVSPSSPIGVMGSTGNTTGPHLHVNRFKVDINGQRLNRNNGTLGGIDPLPFLLGNISTPPISSGGDNQMTDRDKFRILRSVLYSNPNPSEADVDQAVGSMLPPYEYGVQDLNNRILGPYVKQNNDLTETNRITTEKLNTANATLDLLDAFRKTLAQKLQVGLDNQAIMDAIDELIREADASKGFEDKMVLYRTEIEKATRVQLADEESENRAFTILHTMVPSSMANDASKGFDSLTAGELVGVITSALNAIIRKLPGLGKGGE